MWRIGDRAFPSLSSSWGLILSIAWVAGCSSQELSPLDAAADRPVIVAVDAYRQVPILVIDASQIPPTTQDLPPDGFTFPDPPAVACDAVAEGDGGADTCFFPPSSCGTPDCADAAMCPDVSWMVYYDNGRCVNGACVWDRHYYRCSGYATTCQNGSCYYNGTTIP